MVAAISLAFLNYKVQVPVSAFDQYLVALSGMSQTFINGFGTKDFVIGTSCWPVTTGL